MKTKIYLLSILLIVVGTSNMLYAAIYSVPLNVNGFYRFDQEMNFNIDIGVQFSQINEVRFLAQGDIYTDSYPMSFVCVLFASQNNLQYAETQEIFSTSPPISVPFTANTSFIPYNGANWNFLLDGIANGSVGLFTKSIVLLLPNYRITGNITSASIVIDAVPVPEPATFLFMAAGLIAMKRGRYKQREAWVAMKTIR